MEAFQEFRNVLNVQTATLNTLKKDEHVGKSIIGRLYAVKCTAE